MKAIQVLRIHLLEIEKVNELCIDFSKRYIETITLKLNSDNIFKSDDDEEECAGDDDECNNIMNESKTNSNEINNENNES